jgi:hypothetical protein
MAWDFETDAEYQAQLDWAGGEGQAFAIAQTRLGGGRDYSPSDDRWPSQHIPRRLAAAREKYAGYREHEVGNQ